MKAPEFPQNLQWFNSKPLTISELRGKTVLIDFWTYSCVNCIRALPYLKEWHKKYADKGLVIVGVHTPEFEFEKDYENVQKALKELNIEYPVVLDSDYLLWNLYANQWWPRKFLVDKDGQIIYDHIGEGGYEETEKEIQTALLAIDPTLKLPAAAKAMTSESGGVCYPTTPETYLGALRGQPGSVWNYDGQWQIHREYIEHTGNSKDFEDYISLKFMAFEVNLVLGTKDGQPAEVKLELNGKEIGKIKITEYKMYNLFKSSDYTTGKLKIYSNSDNLRAYAFTFGGCK